VRVRVRVRLSVRVRVRVRVRYSGGGPEDLALPLDFERREHHPVIKLGLAPLWLGTAC
jgi:hypothetical protein